MTTPPPNPTGLALLKQTLDLPTQVLDLGCDLVRDLVGEPVKVAGGMLSDQMYYWQWRNRVRIAHRAAEIMEHDGIARRIVPPSFLLPLLDAAGNVDDPDLQEMWAQLLASGVAAHEHQHPLCIDTLRRMGSDDAHVLAPRLRALLAMQPGMFGEVLLPAGPEQERFVALGVLASMAADHVAYGPGEGVAVRLTPFGRQFAAALLGTPRP